MAKSGSEWERTILEGRRWDDGVARGAIAAWRRSGLSMVAFARRHGVSPQRLSWWRKRVEDEGDARGVAPAPFVPVTLAVSTATVEVVVGDVRVHVMQADDVTPAWVAELVATLRRSR